VRMKTKRTVIVAVAVILIIAAIPVVMHARSVRLRNECCNRLRQLYGPMECCVPLSKQLSVGDAINPKDVLAFQKNDDVLRCPCGPEYVVVWRVGGPPPKCPIHGDLLGQTERRQY
jgi:hypothetical protein